MTGRPLRDLKHVNSFLSETLHLDKLYDKDQYSQLVLDIAGMEAQVSSIAENNTMGGEYNRLTGYTTDRERDKLRRDIFKDLSTKERLENDDFTFLGEGGALPHGNIQYEKTAFFIIGLPASGKSGVANSLADRFGAIVLDSDLAKRKFPEYKAAYGASLVHEESSAVVFGWDDKKRADEPNLLQFSVKNGANIIIPKIGSTIESITALASELGKNHGYKNHLILVRLSREKATIRAIERFKKTDRYVPITLIYDGYGNEPTIVFYDILNIENTEKLFESFTMISSDVEFGEKKPVILATEKSPLRELDV